MAEAFTRLVPGIAIERGIVPDEEEKITAELLAHAGCDWIFTTGGTGPAPRDVTPQATLKFVDREMPGLADLLRTESLGETPFACFSRGVAGMKGVTYVVNAPGSVKAAALCAAVFAPLLEHGRDMARGEGHGSGGAGHGH